MSKTFSTGPLENQNGVDTTTTVAWVKVLNNDEDDATDVHIKVFSLSGAIVLLGEAQLTVQPGSSSSSSFPLASADEFEVQIELKDETDDVLISVFGKNANDDLVAAHRVLHTELAKIDELTE